MNKYHAKWVMNDGKEHREHFEADTYEVLPNGVAMFVVFPVEPQVSQINLTPNQPQESPPPKVEIVGTATGFIAIHRDN